MVSGTARPQHPPSTPTLLPRGRGRGWKKSIPQILKPPIQRGLRPLAHRGAAQRLQMPARSAAQLVLMMMRTYAFAAQDAAVAIQHRLGGTLRHVADQHA